MSPLRWMHMLWALPVSLPGVVFWLGVRLRHGRSQAFTSSVQGGWVLLAQGESCAGLLDKYPFFQVDALAVGWIVLARDENTLERCLTHELVHVQQALRWGVLFPLLYLASSAWALCRGQDPYLANVFERAAFEAEKQSPK